MDKLKIVWSHKAETKLFQILDFYTERNQSKSYSIKLNSRIRKQLSIIQRHPGIGVRTEIETIRGLVFDNFILFYEIDTDIIIIHSIWDCRQDLKNLSTINK